VQQAPQHTVNAIQEIAASQVLSAAQELPR